MDKLWAPWRAEYVTTPKPPGQDDPCFICEKLARHDDRADLVLLRQGNVAVMLNRYPYNNGHLLVMPKQHKSRLDELTVDEVLETQQMLGRMVKLLDRAMQPGGYNIGLNLGKVAGAGLPGHLHWHIVPRWFGDTNFMPVVSDTRVIVQSLAALYDLLHNELGNEHAAG
jgi:ATP adenylyltransferase